MSSFEESEFEELIGDQIVTVRRSHEELFAQGDIELTLDGHKVRLPRIIKGYDPVGKKATSRLTTIYDAANQLYGKELSQKNPIPILCHREHMTPVAVCRVCVVDVKGSPRLVPACQRPIEPGMEISTLLTSPRVRSAVTTLVELLLSDYHPPRGQNLEYGETGENELETIARSLGIAKNRFPRGAGDRPRDDSSLLISVDHNACILCDRCIRGCNEIRHNNVLGRAGKGYTARIAFDLNDPMGNSSCVTCGECMVSCPTGALTNRAVVGKELPQEAGTVSPEDLAELPLFKGISVPFLRWNRNAVVRRHFRKGEIICREGEYGSTAFIMEKGRFEVRIKSPMTQVEKHKGGIFSFFSRFSVGLGKRDPAALERQPFIPVDAPVSLKHGDPVAVLDPSDVLFGEMTCMSQYPRSATVTALEDCTVLEILRNVLYMLQRNEASRKVLDEVYRRRTLETHLRSVKIFASLIPESDEFKRFVEFLKPRVRLVRVHPGQIVVRQGAVADHFYMVRSGFIKVSQSRQGVERVLNYIGPGGYFGEIGLLGHLAESLGISAPGERVATCSALDHVDLVRLDKETFLELLEMFPRVRQQIIEVAREHLRLNALQSLQVERESLGEFLDQGLMNAGNVLVLDLERCTRCDECTKACADAHGGVTRLIREGLRFDKFLVASSCRSCLDPYCLVGCPVAAIERTEGGDINIKDTCIGCGKCAENCPYGNINMVGLDTETIADPAHPDRRIAVQRQKATTCDKCQDTVPKGQQPSCVYACPHEAAHRMDGKELLELVRQRNARG
jgi:CRP-like cAMP-binding protein/Fe-S-cluster-containing dehydrogenase component